SALAGGNGEGAGAEEEDGEEAEEHAEVDAGLVHGGPEALVAEERPLGGDDGDGDIDEQRHGHEAAADAEDEGGAADDLDDSDERRREVRVGDSDFGEAACAEGVRVKKFEDAFGEEDPADDEAEEEESPGAAGGGCFGHGCGVKDTGRW